MAGRDHGGGLDAAMARFGGTPSQWLDLSTGINPAPYPLPAFTPHDWGRLPDAAAQGALIEAACRLWNVPSGAEILAAPGASALIARIPALAPVGRVEIPAPTYNEHAAAFAHHGWTVSSDTTQSTDARVVVNPNNPDGRIWPDTCIEGSALTIIDESFCDVTPEASLITLAARDDVLILKSFGKFWGLAGARLGFAIGAPWMIDALREALGPWPVAGPVLRLGTLALNDTAWQEATRAQLRSDAARLDRLTGWPLRGGTDLFRLYEVPDAAARFEALASKHVLTRIFPYSSTLIRLGVPNAQADWDHLEAAL